MAPVLSEEEAVLNPYTLLEVESDATEKDIQRAFRKKSLKCHPDRNPSPEAAVQFRQISLALEILTDVNKRSYVDTKLENDRKKREKYAASDAKRKAMIDALTAREDDAKRAKVEQAERRRQAAEEEAIKDAGRKMLEQAQRRAALAQAQAQAQAGLKSAPLASEAGPSRQAMDGSATQPEITPADLTLIISLPPHSPIVDASIQSDLERRYGPISHVIYSDPPKVEGKKKKSKKVVVEFAKGNWGGCWACWKDHELAKGLNGGKVRWAAGQVPEWVAWAEQQKESGATVSSGGTNGHSSNATSQAQSNMDGPTFSFNTGQSADMPSSDSAPSFASAPDFGGTTMADLLASHAKGQADAKAQKRKNDDFESMTLLRMRQMERERLEEQIRREEAEAT
ncbi:hypothetical protein IAU60_001784 [Kwoniella sp. DSM 27419]